ncbi:hypothetical protein JAAARDRAFT_63410 [Jaapia argillacea MUCL 33604]|uniref:Uncharacterized protein n=1 Tax=Jaapia argillacea MUCL 33604 TaxID=933084 RepID=A0A067P534_9AGAM|nr:hypothetical protein JAAARDRAFT_63410 [Jaapia argillacea MUCL 33604]
MWVLGVSSSRRSIFPKLKLGTPAQTTDHCCLRHRLQTLRVPLSFTVPPHPRTRHVATWPPTHPLIEAAKVGDTIRLIIPAVYGREAKPGAQGGGFQRLEVWQVAAHVFTDW